MDVLYVGLKNMNEYTIKPAAKADIDALIATLSARRIPHTESNEVNLRIVRVGPDNDFEVHLKNGRIGGKSARVVLRFDHPLIKALIQEWSDRCGTEIDDDFFRWHMGLSPTVITGIKNRWRVDLTELEATPVKIGQVALIFMFSRNMNNELFEQLADIPHRRMAKDEFLECADYVAKGDDPFDTEVYGWRSEVGSELFAVIQSAPTQTMLSLWVISEGSSARHNIKKI